jgi:hypothetical protein
VPRSTIRLCGYRLSVTLTMAQTNPLTLRPPPGALPEWRAAAERADLTLHAWMRRHIEQGLQLERALEAQRELEERQARRRADH